MSRDTKDAMSFDNDSDSEDKENTWDDDDDAAGLQRKKIKGQ